MKYSLRLITLLVILAVLIIPTGLPAVSAAGTRPDLVPGDIVPLLYNPNATPTQIESRPIAADPRSTQGTPFIIDYVPDQERNQMGDICMNFPEQAMPAFQAAADNLGQLITSNVPIRIEACWSNMPTGVLGHSRATVYARKNNVYYPIALANAISGIDNYPESDCINARIPLSRCDDITIAFSSDYTNDFYYGTDGNPGSNKLDLETLTMHEIIHGLGFMGSMYSSDGIASWGVSSPSCTYPTIYDTFTVDYNGNHFIDTDTYPCNSVVLAQNLTNSSGAWFDGPNTKIANYNHRALLHTPSTWVQGSSYIHLSSNYSSSINALMLPAIGLGQSTHNFDGIGMGILQDLGWQRSHFDIFGRITDHNGSSLMKTDIVVSNGAGYSTTTTYDGYYSLYNLVPGTYTLTASRPEYTCLPNSQTVTISTASLININFTCDPTTYSASGKVTFSDGTPAEGVFIGTGLWSWYTATTDADGNYTINNMPPGTYPFKPVKAGYTFSPVEREIKIPGNATGVNFTAFDDHTVSGRVVLMNQGDLSGVTIRDDAGHSTTVAADGTYALHGVRSGVRTITPSKTGYFFPESSATITVEADVTGVNFTTWQKGYSISGKITFEDGTPLAGATVNTGTGGTVTTDSNGNYIIGAPDPKNPFYSFGFLFPGSYTITASKTGYIMAPTNQNVTIDSADLTQVNFTATLITYHPVSGRVILDDGTPAAGIVIQTTTGYSTTTDADGNYSLTLPTGTHTLIPIKQKFAFSPTTRVVIIAGAAHNDANFTATFHSEFSLFFMPTIRK